GPRGDSGCIDGKHRDRDFGAGNSVRTTDALCGARVERLAVVFGNDENLAHYTSPFFFSASTSSCAVFTITPFCRCGGGSYFSGFTRWRGVTPRAATATVSSGFFFAFMMSGSFT